MTQLSHKIRLYPNQEAEAYLRRSVGVARFSWNWALATWNAKYLQGEKGMSGYSLVKEFNSIKGVDFPWIKEVSKWSPQKSIQNLGDAFNRFFEKLAKRPRFKKKGKCRESFYISADHIKLSGKYLKLPKLGDVKRLWRRCKTASRKCQRAPWQAAVLREARNFKKMFDKGLTFKPSERFKKYDLQP